ncbi:homoserine kinase [Euzebya rosea]|uniref:homoserine kinase n=1 Tax=Euzebya rosea TaxID=2052804 RepID=UPI000D3E79DF|nr:homoserine kinase [Euzebya rosea]
MTEADHTVAMVADTVRAVDLDADLDGRSVVAAVEVPATSANLGPGYDALGVALDVPLLAIARAPGPERVTSHGLGAGELPTGEGNLVWRAVVAWCERVGADVPDVSIDVHSAIPLERGMGSSSAAAVAGLVLARALVGGPGGNADVLELATALEGHPDNAAAAIAGGLVACLPDGGFQRVTPDTGLIPVLLIPTTRQNTGHARGVLPVEVPLAVAAANGARAVATFAGLAGLVPLQAAAMVDELHEPPRLAIMTTSGQLVGRLREAGVPAALSGAGPSVLAVLDHPSQLRVVADAVDAVDGAVEVLETTWNLAGARVHRAPVPA